MRGRPLHHIALGTPRVEVLAAFYEEALGLKRIRSHQDSTNELRSIWLRSDTVVLMVERTAYLESMEHEPLRSGWATLIFGGAFDPLALTQDVQRLGGAEDGATDYTYYFRDPDGNRFGVSSYVFEDNA